MTALSPDTQTLLLLTAGRFLGDGVGRAGVLSPAEYAALAKVLNAFGRSPVALREDASLQAACSKVLPIERLKPLLSAALLVAVLTERMERYGITVVGAYDEAYPAFLKAPCGCPLLWSAGDRSRLQDGQYLFAESPMFVDDLLKTTSHLVVFLTDALWENALKSRWLKPLSTGQLLLVSPLEPRALYTSDVQPYWTDLARQLARHALKA